MVQQMHTDEGGMAAAAGQFDHNCAQLKTLLKTVDGIGQALVPQFKGQSGSAAQAALARYQQAQQPLISEMDTISQNIRESGLQYGSSDQAGVAPITNAFNFGSH
ncbi:WXG repeat protein [Mycobacteroides abscessus subsp. massiliense]|uniref:WXG repeat protein n=1 Tax=Mycobacteroides abscessus subsp. massiliense TaxID=1962118 RepID=A0A1T8VA19_9MYCO|nr:WXG100 family type VII secretion target [Mycobacteroides abscessus]SKN01934.1 WXG repeat protein [Mycobacteroides abscessus subsp. massiliense]